MDTQETLTHSLQVDTAVAVLLSIGIQHLYGYTSTRDDVASKPSNYRLLHHEISLFMQSSTTATAFHLSCMQYLDERDSLINCLSDPRQLSADVAMNSYYENVKNILSNPTVNLLDKRSIATIASMPEAFKNLKKEPDLPYKGFFGQIKQRGPLKLQLTTKPTLDESREYPVMKFKFKDQSGLIFAWNASISAAPQTLVAGQWYEMSATIENHYASKKGDNITYLSRCSDIKLSSAETPPPDFVKAATSRHIPDHIELEFSMKNHQGIIDGGVYLVITRRWFEAGSTRQVSRQTVAVLDWNRHPELLPPLLNRLIAPSGVTRADTEISRTDLKLAEKLQSKIRHLYDVNLLNSKTIFVVDNAFSTMSIPQTRHSISTSRRVRRIFLDYASAESHALMEGRGICVLSEIHVPGLSWMPYPSEFQQQDGFEQFLQCVELSGLDVAASIKPNGHLGKLYPILRQEHAWSLLRAATFIKQELKHAPLNTLESSTLCRFSFIAVTGLMLDKLIPSFSQLQFSDASHWISQKLNTLHPRIESHTHQHLPASIDSILESTHSETIENQKGFVYIVLTDPVGVDCMRLLGASVIQIHFTENPPADTSDCLFLPQNLSEHTLLSELKKATEDAFFKLQTQVAKV